VVQVAECLSSKLEALGSIFSAAKKEGKEGRREEGREGGSERKERKN
jgi:hypothetical protein